VQIKADFHNAAGAELNPFTSIHHRTETITGLGDVKLFGVVHHRWSEEASSNWVSMRLGLSIPIGSTEPDPYVLGTNKEEHQHIFLGTGTFDPHFIASVGRRWAEWLVSGTARASGAVYENQYGYQAGLNTSAGVGVGYGKVDAWRLIANAEYGYEKPSIWSGRQARNSGSSTISVGLILDWALGLRNRMSIAVDRPFILSTASGQLEMPFVARIGYSYRWTPEAPETPENPEEK
jgi:hypothetical protein